MLETDHQSRASLQADDIGQIEVEPSTRLRLLTMGAGLKRIALDRGTIHTYIWAPAGQFDAIGSDGRSGLRLHLAGGRVGRGAGAYIARMGRIQAEWPRVLHPSGRSLRDQAESRSRHALLRKCVG